MELPARQKSLFLMGSSCQVHATDELQNPSSYSTQKRTVDKQTKGFLRFLVYNKASVRWLCQKLSEVLNLLRTLPKNKACGQDCVSTMLLKEADALIAPSLTNLFNLSIRTGFFLRDRKLARVTPIYKDDKKCIPGNYRPVFVLPA